MNFFKKIKIETYIKILKWMLREDKKRIPLLKKRIKESKELLKFFESYLRDINENKTKN